MTPLMTAAVCGEPEAAQLVALLLRHGASVARTNTLGFTALDVARISRSPRSQNLYRLEDAFGSINPASDNVLALLEEAERLRHGKRPHNPQAGAAKRSKAPGA